MNILLTQKKREKENTLETFWRGGKGGRGKGEVFATILLYVQKQGGGEERECHITKL